MLDFNIIKKLALIPIMHNELYLIKKIMKKKIFLDLVLLRSPSSNTKNDRNKRS